MATRSIIFITHPDGVTTHQYCHWDGHPDGVGATLRKYWTTPRKLAALAKLGDLSILGSKVGKEIPFHPGPGRLKDGTPDQCLAYGRDRGETGIEPGRTTGGILAAMFDCGDRGQEYIYHWDGQQWLCGLYRDWRTAPVSPL